MKTKLKTVNRNYLVSIITIVFNGANYIEDTILSVLNQTYKNIEYIIIDGSSTDGTIDIIKKYENKINFWISEKDNGIYDAMNKGTLKARGKWLNYMNSGDRFYKNTTIEDVSKELNKAGNIAVIYGNTEIVFDKYNKYIRYAKSSGHKYHHQFIHQSSFIRHDIAMKYLYDTKFKIAGDTDFFTKIYNKGYEFVKIDNIISVFSISGISSDLNLKMYLEEAVIIGKYSKLELVKFTLVFFIKKLIYSTFPYEISKKIKIIYGKKYLSKDL
ncbi:MAG: glycosyltransferase [Campylobacteraceae bacterium]|jgi:glycosyltransferase involved in cell wall biosynthesis|nr:glycosyltransferase [Campylobacteraceae bacterium]